MTEPVTAYLTHKPWSAADGGKLHGSIRVIEHTGKPTGLVHRFEQRDRASAGDRTRDGKVKAIELAPEPRPKREPKPLPITVGWLTLVGEPTRKVGRGGKNRTVVTVQCRCERRMDVERHTWASKWAPHCCSDCVTAWRRAFPKQTKASRTQPAETRSAA